jgi:hypothetical protein
MIFKGIEHKYELFVLHPAHFLARSTPISIIHPTTGVPANFYVSGFPDGFLREGSPTGHKLPSFGSQGVRETQLNPILVNWAAHIRLRRKIRENTNWGSDFTEPAFRFLQHIIRLHELVIWEPNHPPKSQSLVRVPNCRFPAT